MQVTSKAARPAAPTRAPIRVTHVITGLSLGGAEHTLVKLLSATDRNAFEPSVVVLNEGGPLFNDIVALGVPVVALGGSTGGVGALRVASLVPALRALRPEVVQTWLYKADLVGGLAARSLRVPVLWNLRQTSLDRQRSTRSNRTVARLCARLSRIVPDAIVCVSDSALHDHAAAGYDRSRMRVIENGFDTGKFRPDPSAKAWLRAELDLDPACRIVGNVARFNPQKDHRNLLAAASRCLSVHADCAFVLVGEGVDSDNSQLASMLNNTEHRNRIYLMGPRRDIDRITPAFDIAVSSSAFGEGFSNALGEAMACEVPCVATDSGNARDLLAECGVVVPPRDPVALAEAVVGLLSQPPDVRSELGRRGRRLIESRHSLVETTRCYEALYREMAGAACVA